MPHITLTTDFGLKDNYVGSLHGAILAINPNTTISDISHLIPSFDIVEGAYMIGSTYFLYPKGTIHVGVVDPGVGSERLPILLVTKDYFFVGPDNGLFSMVALKERIKAIYHLENTKYFRSEVSDTFHGRDIFSPVAAHLSRGVPPKIFGPRVKSFKRLKTFDLAIGKKKISGRIISIDKFGNAVTNISQKDFKAVIKKSSFSLSVRTKKFTKIHRTYSEVKKGQPLLLFDSCRFLEIASNQGSAAKKLHLKVGQQAILRTKM